MKVAALQCPGSINTRKSSFGLHTDGAISIHKSTTCKPEVRRLAFKQNFLLRSPAIRAVDAVLDGNDAGSALATTTAVRQLTTKCVDVNLLGHQRTSEICVSVNIDDRATVILHDLHLNGVLLLGGILCCWFHGTHDCDRCYMHLAIWPSTIKRTSAVVCS